MFEIYLNIIIISQSQPKQLGSAGFNDGRSGYRKQRYYFLALLSEYFQNMSSGRLYIMWYAFV